jgi:hypothetical protein
MGRERGERRFDSDKKLSNMGFACDLRRASSLERVGRLPTPLDRSVGPDDKWRVGKPTNNVESKFDF